MKVRHVKPQGDISAGSFDDSVWAYRTEVHNPFEFPIRVIWFQAFTNIDGIWYGNNIRNRVLLEDDFAAWYGDGGSSSDAWIQPGGTAACDPNWHYGNPDDQEFNMKWSFISIDGQGNSYFDEAEVTRENATFFERTQESCEET